MVDQHWVRAWSISAGSAAAVTGSFLPWLRSGSVDRSSYEIFDLVDRLGFSPDGAVGWALRLWPLVPLLFVVATVLQWTWSVHRVLVMARRLVPVVAACYAGSVAFTLQLAPDAGLFRFRFGTWVTAIGSLVVLVATLWPVRRRPVTRRGSGASAAS